jgi:hypothetical protein
MFCNVQSMTAEIICTENFLRSSEIALQVLYTDKKENQIFLIYKEIQSGAVAKS